MAVSLRYPARNMAELKAKGRVRATIGSELGHDVLYEMERESFQISFSESFHRRFRIVISRARRAQTIRSKRVGRWE